MRRVTRERPERAKNRARNAQSTFIVIAMCICQVVVTLREQCNNRKVSRGNTGIAIVNMELATGRKVPQVNFKNSRQSTREMAQRAADIRVGFR